MRAHPWVVGLVGVGAAMALSAAGCGSSSSGGGGSTRDDSGADAADETVCTPTPVMTPDAGACGACISTMCSSQVSECSGDCTCGTTINNIAGCLTSAGPIDAGGGLASLLGGPLLQIATCIGGGALGTGGGGLLGGGAAGGLGAAGGSATTDYLTCLGTTCGGPCFGLGDAGLEGGMPGTDGGMSESGVSESGVSESGASDAPGEATTVAEAAADGPDETSAPVEASTDAPSE